MPALGYYNVDLVLIRQKCVIEAGVTTLDTLLTSALRQAYGYMNRILVRYTTVPLATSDELAEIEADIGAGMFKEERTIPIEGERVKKHILRERGEQELLDYIKTHYEASGTRRGSFFRNTRTQRRLEIDASEPDIVDEVD